MKNPLLILTLMAVLLPAPLGANEVLDETPARVEVRVHPKTGKAYTVITAPGRENQPLLRAASGPVSRPDYRLLDPSLKAGEVPYDGPVSDRRKVYLFAASVAALGAASGVAVIAAAPAATGTAAAGGAGVYAGTGVGVVAGTAAATTALTREKPGNEDFQLTSESRELDPREIRSPDGTAA